MPRVRGRRSDEAEDKETRISLAVEAINENRFPSVRQACLHYGVPSTTVQNRLSGVPCRAETRANSHKLTQHEEESLVSSLLRKAEEGTIPRKYYIRQMANDLLRERGDSPAKTVGNNWVTNFLKRWKETESIYPRKTPRRYVAMGSQGGGSTNVDETGGQVRAGRRPTSSAPKTLYRLGNLESHISTMKELLGTESSSLSSSPVFDNLVKGMELMMEANIALLKENRDLRNAMQQSSESQPGGNPV